MKGNHGTDHRHLGVKAGIGLLLLPLLFMGCRRLPPQPTVPPEPTVHQSGQDLSTSSSVTRLAGTWEYNDGQMVHCLRLNEAGNAQYDWQGGHFVTTAFFGDKWKGIWLQTQNDREGEFQLLLAEDGKKAEGDWWYTRIEDDLSPTQPGGRFVLRKMPCCSPSNDNQSLAHITGRAGTSGKHSEC